MLAVLAGGHKLLWHCWLATWRHVSNVILAAGNQCYDADNDASTERERGHEHPRMSSPMTPWCHRCCQLTTSWHMVTIPPVYHGVIDTSSPTLTWARYSRLPIAAMFSFLEYFLFCILDYTPTCWPTLTWHQNITTDTPPSVINN